MGCLTRFGCLLFIVGMALAFGGPFYIVLYPNASPVLGQVYCTPSETFVRTARANDNVGTNINFYCESTDGGARRDVDHLVVYTIIGLVSPLVLSIGLMIAGSRAATPQPVRFVDGDSDGLRVQIFSSGGFAPGLTVAQKLQQLQEAHDAGLITRAEFEEHRRRVLEDLSDDD